MLSALNTTVFGKRVLRPVAAIVLARPCAFPATLGWKASCPNKYMCPCLCSAASSKPAQLRRPVASRSIAEGRCRTGARPRRDADHPPTRKPREARRQSRGRAGLEPHGTVRVGNKKKKHTASSHRERMKGWRARSLPVQGFRRCVTWAWDACRQAGAGKCYWHALT